MKFHLRSKIGPISKNMAFSDAHCRQNTSHPRNFSVVPVRGNLHVLPDHYHYTTNWGRRAKSPFKDSISS